jgi:phosphatidylserine/phosphatidylglycerophosphate/cardiolipin synthase-like enzyme
VTSLVDQERARGDYPSRFEAKRLEVDRTRLLLAPDNAEGEILEVIESAQEEIAVKQVRIGDRTLPFFQALLAAARDGVRVRILLSGEWYVREDNRRLARWVERRANSQNLPIEVRLATPAGRYEKIHAKGMIVDEQTVLLGSLNWNKNSIRQNREVALLLDSTGVAAYYGEVFAADWSGSPDRTGLPAGLALVVVAVALLAVGRAMYIQFDR